LQAENIPTAISAKVNLKKIQGKECSEPVGLD
jgi:hypothetical protein